MNHRQFSNGRADKRQNKSIGLKALLLVCIAGLCGSLSAMGPDSIAGYVLREDFGTLGTIRHTRYAPTVVFSADGTYRTIFALRTEIIGEITFQYYDGGYGSGTYTYTRTNEKTAVLRLNPPTGQSVTLEFSESDLNGFGADGIASGTFTLTRNDAETPLVNVSSRVPVVKGKPSIVGFIIGGSQPRDVLVRAVGPGLSDFGVPGYWRDPDYTLHSNRGVVPFVEGRTGDWDATPNAAETLTRVMSECGVFPLKPGSKDAADVFRLAPGAYTVVVESQEDTISEVLLEVYLLR
jgi:hypothetical protein